jgi:prepilin-type N-terminal cleavage/methylation domain-containing protein
MTLNNIKTIKKDRGFTIVELLIVIVVIGILAAITIVAYNGVQNRARTTQNDTNAREIANKAEAYAADNNGTYPTVANLTGAAAGTSYQLSTTAAGVIQSAAPTSTTQTKVQYLLCTGNGFKVQAWDYTTAALSTTIRTGGTATGTCS